MARKTATPASSTTVATTVTVTPPPVEDAAPVKPVVEAPTDVPPEVSNVDKLSTVLEKLLSFQNEVKELISIVKVVQKEYNKIQKQTNKKTKKSSNASTGNRAPSGFAKPTRISDQLCEFLGVSKGSSLARTEVTRVINTYIKQHNLQDSTDKRRIIPNAALRVILGLKEGEVASYFTLQRLLKSHFLKETVSA